MNLNQIPDAVLFKESDKRRFERVAKSLNVSYDDCFIDLEQERIPQFTDQNNGMGICIYSVDTLIRDELERKLERVRGEK